MNGGDDDGARLIALNMALNGTPREETDRYLAENFELSDRRGLLDEVYARARRLTPRWGRRSGHRDIRARGFSPS